MIEIDLEELELVMQKLLDYLKESGHCQLRIERDYYWFVGAQDKYDVYKEPTGLTIGQLVENWEHLEKIANNESMAIGYAFVWLGELLRAIGEDIV